MNYSEEALLKIIYLLCRENGYCWHSNDYLAKAWKRGPRHVRRALKKLVGLGLVRRRIKFRNGKAKRYLKIEEKTMTKNGLIFNEHKHGDQRDQINGTKRALIPFPKGKVITRHAVGGVGGEKLNPLLGDTNDRLKPILRGFWELCSRTGNRNYRTQGQFRHCIRNWRKQIHCLLEASYLKGDWKRFVIVAEWYLKHEGEPWVPGWNGVEYFCNTFPKIQSAMYRQEIKDGTRDPEESSERIDDINIYDDK